MPRIDEICALKRGVEPALLQLPGVTGIDVGFKYVGGRRTDEVAIRVHVAEKKEVGAGERIPSVFDGVRSDVISRRFVLHHGASVPPGQLEGPDTTVYRPLRGGGSVGPGRPAQDGSPIAGTLALIIRDRSTGVAMALSNFHVLAGASGRYGDPVYQPSLRDGGVESRDRIGILYRARLTSTVDCAAAHLADLPFEAGIVESGQVTGVVGATLDLPVRKRGRTSRQTYGFVDSVDLTLNLEYGPGIGKRTLYRQIGIRADPDRNAIFGQDGDSGSAVLDEQNRVVGLYFAASADGTFGVASPFQAVLDALDATLFSASDLRAGDITQGDTTSVFFSSNQGGSEMTQFNKEQELSKSVLNDKVNIKAENEKQIEKIKAENEKQIEKIKAENEKLGDKHIEKIKPEHEKLVFHDKHFKIEKTEIKEGKELKHEKIEVKEHTKEFIAEGGKDLGSEVFQPGGDLVINPAKTGDKNIASEVSTTKSFASETAKDFSSEVTKPFKERIKEKIEKFEHKEFKEKNEKPEIKEGKDKNEKFEIKETKFEVKEAKEFIAEKSRKEIFEKDVVEGGKNLVENPGFPGDITTQPVGGFAPAAAQGGSIEERLARLEAQIGQLAHFIGQDQRPDLTSGALTGEEDQASEGEAGGSEGESDEA